MTLDSNKKKYAVQMNCAKHVQQCIIYNEKCNTQWEKKNYITVICTFNGTNEL